MWTYEAIQRGVANHIYDEHHEPIAQVLPTGEPMTVQAERSRLMAAAPSLLEALRDLEASCRNWAPTIDRSRARAAIRLAEVGQ